MLVLASLVLISGSWVQANTCPGSFLTTSTTVGAITNSSSLSLCVSKAQLVTGSNGSLTLVIGGTGSTSPRCLIYPNGLSPDLTFQLIQSGHVGCWSLYPPGQPITIVNVGTPSTARIQSALKQFKPDIPRITVSPKAPYRIGGVLKFGSTAASKLIKASLLGLPLQVRFKPVLFSWVINPLQKTFSSSTFSLKATAEGIFQTNLRVGFSVEYSFPGITSWRIVKPNILVSAAAVSYQVLGQPIPPKVVPPIPRLVGGPCERLSKAWGC